MSLPRTNIVKVDLADNLKRYERGVLLASADKAANKMGAEVYQDGKAASLTGYTVVGYFIRTGVDTITINGTVEGNKAYVVLPESCYYQDGGFTLSVKLRKSGYEQTLAIFDGFIAQTITNRIIDSAKVVPFMETVLKRNCYNLLDNSDFRNPVNQRGRTSYSGGSYMIDRWKGGNADITVNDGSVSVLRGSRQYALFVQFVPNIKAGKTYTVAAENTAGEIAILSFTADVTMSNKEKNFSVSGHTIIARYSTDAKKFFVGIANTTDTPLDIVWIALYEGTYTAVNLPPYVPKGYAAELLECQRYYYQLSGLNARFACGIYNHAGAAIIPVTFPVPMRVQPKLTYSNAAVYRAGKVESATFSLLRSYSCGVLLMASTTDGTSGESCMLASPEGTTAVYEFSAEL